MAGDPAPDEKPVNKPTKYTAVQLQAGQVVPQGAVLMARNEVLEMQLKMIKNYKPQSDMWPFRWGGGFVSMSAALAGLMINSHFRHKFVLRNYGIPQTYFPIVAFPVLCCLGCHTYIKHCLLTMKHCPTCINVRSGVLQVFCSTIYSTLLAGPICIQLSKHYHTYVLTKNNFQPNVFHAVKTTPFAWYCYLGLIVLNFATGYLTAHLQGRALEKAQAVEAKKYHEGNIAWK